MNATYRPVVCPRCLTPTFQGRPPLPSHAAPSPLVSQSWSEAHQSSSPVCLRAHSGSAPCVAAAAVAAGEKLADLEIQNIMNQQVRFHSRADVSAQWVIWVETLHQDEGLHAAFERAQLQ